MHVIVILSCHCFLSFPLVVVINLSYRLAKFYEGNIKQRIEMPKIYRFFFVGIYIENLSRVKNQWDYFYLI